MSGILFLTDEDFKVIRGPKGDLLCSSVQGFSVVLFYSKDCKHCQTLIPVFKQLPNTVGGCQFGMLNISQARKCIEMSKTTSTVIRYVPYIIFYVGGKPYMTYNGEYTINHLKQFIMDCANSIKKQNFVKQEAPQNQNNNQNPPPQQQENELPKYISGKPLCSDNVCYLQFDRAYINVV